VLHNGDTLTNGEYFIAATTILTSISNETESVVVPTINEGLPLYNFSTLGLESLVNQDSVAGSQLGNIRIVPNPYYAYSSYETDRLDNRVKVINLPKTCTISIYSVNGTLIRQFSKDDPTQTWIDWDLKNHAFVPIASGVYIVHIEAPEIGEIVLKWFGALRPTDLDSF
ncbi:T9SS type A sorting domain-containing protein, partial [bacterium]|nr:T9SS type A sorting domain-containing protein [bacterium]